MRVKLMETGTELQFTYPLNPELRPFQAFPLTMVATSHWGTIIFQLLDRPGFSIRYSKYIIKEKTSFMIEGDTSSIRLRMAYKNLLDFELIDLGIELKEGEFNLIYMPKGSTIAHFGIGEFAAFDIVYHEDYLQKFIPYFPALKGFLENTEKNLAGHLSQVHPRATPRMFEAINNILHYEHQDDLSNIYMECKAVELLTLAIAKMSRVKDKYFTLGDAEYELFDYAKNWLTDNVDNPGSLSDISKRFGINECKLKKGFKQLYGTTIFDYLLKIRLDRARQQLLTTKMSVAEIAYRAGYSNHNHFTVAFKKHFNYSPNYIRKK
jgi:AraC-like DNA-binding protein